jgi:hypothetical protein
MTAYLEALQALVGMGLVGAIIPFPILATVLGVSSLASGTFAIAQSEDGRPVALWLGLLCGLTGAVALFGLAFLVLNPV